MSIESKLNSILENIPKVYESGRAAGTGVSVQPDWNQNDETAPDFIKNKPFGDNRLFDISWDGNTDGKVVYPYGDYPVYKVSSDVIELEDLIVGFTISAISGDESTSIDVTTDQLGDFVSELSDSSIAIAGGLLIIEYSDTEDTERGVYFCCMEGMYISNISSLNVMILDKKYVPYAVTKENPVFVGSFSMNQDDPTVNGGYSHAEGWDTTASGSGSHAEGHYTDALGNYSHAEGGSTAASGDYSHAEGHQNHAEGDYSHTEGQFTTASGEGSHAEGYQTIASGDYSHAEGHFTKATGADQHVQGRYNILDDSKAHVVGNGTPNNLSNAHTLDWDGTAWYAGDVYVGSTSGINRDEGSKKLATEEYVDYRVPVKGRDYWTDEDKASLVTEVLESLDTWTGGSY